MKGKKAQISLEFIIMTTAIIAFSISILYIISFYNNVEIRSKNSESISNFIEYLQNEVIIATKLQDGYIKTFDLPERINNNQYTITIQNNDLIVSYEGKQYIQVIPEVIGDFNIPNNTIRKIDGSIYIN